MSFKSTVKPIAIIGMAGLFPQAHNATEYWENIINQVDCITDVPADRWSIDEYYDADPQTPDKTYSKRGGFLPEIDFNPLEFGLPPHLLESTDTSQILSLIVAQNALQDAGYGTAKPSIRQRTGVVLGACMGQKLTHPLTKRLEYPVWEKVLKSHHISATVRQKIIEQIKQAYVEWDENTFPGLLGNVIAGRIANRLDLGGMNCVIDAACASSLSALRMAISELREHRSDMMISGGVDTDNSLFAYMCFSKTPALSRQEQIRPFDAQADGMLLGEGIGMVVLKRLEDAERDGDRIYAIIKGLGAASDGKYKSIYAPRSSGQALALQRAYEEAGVPPTSVGLVEAHGTGTRAGDPAEIKGLTQVFQENNPNQQYIALGSVKSQIGHTKAAAGAASLIKAALALHHKILPPTINVTQPHSELKNSPFYVNTQAKPWLTGGKNAPRRAGISSFGFGGANYHAVLEEYQEEHQQNYRLHPTPESILIHAPNPQALLTKCQQILTQWKSEQGQSSYQQIVHNSISVRIPLSGARLGFVAASLTEALTLLTTAITNLARLPDQPWEHPQGIYYRPVGIDIKGKVVALFSGQGSQYVGMGNSLAMNFPELRQAYSQVDKLLRQDESPSISSVVFPPPAFNQEQEKAQAASLQQTANAQPAIGAFSVGLYKILQQGGFNPDFTAGHSFGELTALWGGGVLNDADYFYLAQARGQAMSETLESQRDSGKMLAVQGDTESVIQAIADFSGVTVANYNSPQQLVLAGNSEEIDHVKQFLEQSNYRVTLLPVAAAFHTDLVSQAQNQFAQAISKVKFQSPQVPVYANTTATSYPETVEEIKHNLLTQMVNPVKFHQEIEQIYQAGGSIFVEFGPRSILTHLVDEILADKPHVAVALNASRNKDSDRQFREAVVKLRVTGLKLTSCDRYKLKPPATPEKSSKGFTVKVTGCNYGAEERKANFLAALEEENKTTASTPSPKEKISQKTISPIPSITQSSLAAKSDMNTHQKQPSNGKTKPATQFATDGADSSSVTPQEQPVMELESTSLSSLERTLMQFQEHQAGINKVQQQYLQNQAEYTQQFLQLVQEKYKIDHPSYVITPQVSQSPTPPTPPSPLSSPSSPSPLSSPSPPSPLSSPSPPSPPTPSTPSTPPSSPSPLSPSPPVPKINLELLTQSLLAIVSDKTGYPVEMLELEMDMEADLGIDSIKRVEILGAMQESFPDLPPVNPEELTELRTLAQIADYMGNRESKERVVTTESVSAISEVANINQGVSSSVANNNKDLRQSLLDLISAQTGYAAEGIELDMDLETDLGIDHSSKQELLNAIASLYSSLVNNQAEILALRTPAQIIEYLGSKKNFPVYP